MKGRPQSILDVLQSILVVSKVYWWSPKYTGKYIGSLQNILVVDFVSVAAWFSRVGGSSWTTKIDPKTPQEMKNNDFEEDRTRTAEKKDNKSTQEEPKMVPWLPRSPQETPKSTSEETRRPPRDPQERPKQAQENPKTLSRPPSDRRRRFFKNRAAAEAGARFLRVVGSS